MDNYDVEESVIAKSTGEQEEKDIAATRWCTIPCSKIKEKDDKRRGRLSRTSN